MFKLCLLKFHNTTMYEVFLGETGALHCRGFKDPILVVVFSK